MPWHLLINKNVNPSFSPQRTCYESRNISKKTIAHTTPHTCNNSKTQYPSLLSTERKIKYTMPYSDQIKENSELIPVGKPCFLPNGMMFREGTPIPDELLHMHHRRIDTEQSADRYAGFCNVSKVSNTIIVSILFTHSID